MHESGTQQYPSIDISAPVITEAHYSIYKIPKFKLVDGNKVVTGSRTIQAPCPELKHLQRDLLWELSRTNHFTSNVSHAFRRGRNIKTMAAPHINARNMIRVDIKDFFPSITETMVINAMMDAGFPTQLINKTRRLCLLNRALPQGAPTSPFLSDIVGRLIDARMIGLANKWRNAKFARIRPRRRNRPEEQIMLRIEPIVYTRYADDLIFSSDYPLLHQIKYAVRAILADLGFRVNPKKLATIRRPNRLVICGITVNEKLSKPLPYRKHLRARLHAIITQKVLGQVPPGMFLDVEDGQLKEIEYPKLEGRVAHIKDVCPSQAKPFERQIRIIRDVDRNDPQSWSEETRAYTNRMTNGSTTGNTAQQ